MYRGTTPTIKLNFFSSGLELSDIKEIWVTMKSVLHKRTFVKREFELDDVEKTASLTISQSDTLKFANGDVRIQLRVLLNDGSAFASNIKTLNMGEILKDGEIL